MLIEHTITRLNDMRLTEMSEAYSSQRERPNMHELSFDERFTTGNGLVGRTGD